METITLYKEFGGDSQDFDCIVFPDYETDRNDFYDINKIYRSNIRAAYQRWKLLFGILTEAHLDFLLALKIEPEPLFVYNFTSYSIKIEEVNAKGKGGSITFTNIEPVP